tara:strand:- start:1989 stop:2909 length:921 start_codon:yes stop_codon:yes gene_type:complete
MRKAFGDALYKLAEKNDRVIFLTGDLGFQVFDDFKNSFSSRYVNVGVAEVQLMCTAAGLALEGWRPIVYSIASFVTARSFEQVKISIAYPHLPVIIVGAGGGFTYSTSGPTHHSPEDLGLMSLLPGMTVVAPGCPEEVRELLPQLARINGPSYIRIGKFGEINYDVKEPVVIGKGRLLREGKKIAVLCTGDTALAALDAVMELRSENIIPYVYQFHTLKPLDVELLESLVGHISAFIIIEEHLPQGGLASSISQLLTGKRDSPVVVRLGVPDEFIIGNPTREELRKRLMIEKESVKKICRNVWNEF